MRAGYRDGVLTVRLTKFEAVKPKEIKIDVA
jgi:HSP20 family molecular chaperone IbpA